MSTGGGYARVYFSILDDEKFDRVYADDHHLATWLRLLLMAEMAHPNAVPLPNDVRTASVRVLVEVGLIDITHRGMYHVHGMRAERDRRSAQGRNAAAVRWHSDSNAPALREQSNGDAPALPSDPIRSYPTRTLSSQSDYDEKVRRTRRVLEEEEKRRARIIASES